MKDIVATKQSRLICAQRSIGVIGVLLATTVIGASLLGFGSAGLGETDMFVLGAAIAIVLLGVLPWTTPVGRRYAELFVLSASVFGTLFAGDLLFSVATRPPPEKKDFRPSLQGLHQADEGIDYSLTPNWKGYYDDGIVRARIQTNSRGHRDDEPIENPKVGKRLLLGGDSYTFGFLLEQNQTIDRQVERLSRGRVDAYNRGVGGYGGATRPRELPQGWMA